MAFIFEAGYRSPNKIPWGIWGLDFGQGEMSSPRTRLPTIHRKPTTTQQGTQNNTNMNLRGPLHSRQHLLEDPPPRVA